MDVALANSVLSLEQFANQLFLSVGMQPDKAATVARLIDATQPVRMPGDQAARGIEHARAQGITSDDATWAELERWAQTLSVALPEKFISPVI